MCIDTYTEFIHAVEATSEPMYVLATNQHALENSQASVTPMTYQNLLTETTRNKNHSILLGPVLIHQTKTLCPFHYFALTLISLNLKLTGLKAYGTDGEPEFSDQSIQDSFSQCYPFEVYQSS